MCSPVIWNPWRTFDIATFDITIKKVINKCFQNESQIGFSDFLSSSPLLLIILGTRAIISCASSYHFLWWIHESRGLEGTNNSKMFLFERELCNDQKDWDSFSIQISTELTMTLTIHSFQLGSPRPCGWHVGMSNETDTEKWSWS